MKDYFMEDYTIEGVTSERLIDSEGVRWYPVNTFYRVMLYKKGKSNELSKGQYREFMKVFEVALKSANNNYKVKTWFINEDGLCRILKNMEVTDKSPRIKIVKQRRLARVLAYFNIAQQVDMDYITYAPDIKKYDIWSYLCITNDTELTGKEVWKRCGECHYYYPATEQYFTISDLYFISNKCNECSGKGFKCENKSLQFLYNNFGTEILYAIYKEDHEKVYDEIMKYVKKGEL